MSRASAPIDVLESAYTLWGDEREWLTRVIEPLSSGVGLGGVLFTFDAATNDMPQRVYYGVCDELQVAVDDEIDATTRALASHDAARAKLIGKTGCATLSSLLDSGSAHEVQPIAEHRASIAQMGFPDGLGIVGRSLDGTGVCFGATLPAASTISDRFRRQWTHVGAHLAAALRLRRSLAARAATNDGESVIDPSRDRVEHAAGPAKDSAALAALRNAVRSVDRARTRRVRREDPLAATELWRGLVAGRWSLIERYDSDGRRFYVAHKNDPAAPALRALSPRERQVAAYAVQGVSNKLIGYQLGLSKSTVANHLTAAQKKLGVASRTELIRLAKLLFADNVRP